MEDAMLIIQDRIQFNTQAENVQGVLVLNHDHFWFLDPNKGGSAILPERYEAMNITPVFALNPPPSGAPPDEDNLLVNKIKKRGRSHNVNLISEVPLLSLTDSTKGLSRFRSKDPPHNSVIMFHGTSDLSEKGLSELFTQEGRINTHQIINNRQALGRGFYLTFSFDEALAYACMSLKSKPNSEFALVLEVRVNDADTFVSKEHPSENTRANTYVAFDSSDGQRQQICLSPNAIRGTEIVKIHKFNKNAIKSGGITIYDSKNKKPCL